MRRGLIKRHGLEWVVGEVADPPSRELDECLMRGDVNFANLYLPNFLERRFTGAPIVGLCTEWKSTGKGSGLFVRRGELVHPKQLEGRKIATHQGLHAIHPYLLQKRVRRRSGPLAMEGEPAGEAAQAAAARRRPPENRDRARLP